MIFIYTLCANVKTVVICQDFFVSLLWLDVQLFSHSCYDWNPFHVLRSFFRKHCLKLTLVIMNSWGSSSLHIIPCWLRWFQCFFSITLACEAWIVGLVLTEIIRATLPSYCVISPNKHVIWCCIVNYNQSMSKTVKSDNVNVKYQLIKNSRLHLWVVLWSIYMYFSIPCILFILLSFCRGKHFPKNDCEEIKKKFIFT